MSTPEDAAVCADIERQLKLLLLPGPKEQCTPKKGGHKNKNYEENFPALDPTQSPGPSPNFYKNAKSPGKPKHSYSPGQRNIPFKNFPPKTPSGHGRDVNGYDYFQGKEIVNFKPDPSMAKSLKSPDNATGFRNHSLDDSSGYNKSFAQNQPYPSSEQALHHKVVDDVGLPSFEEVNNPAKDGQGRQKKRIKKREKRDVQARQEVQPRQEFDSKPLLERLAVNKALGGPNGEPSTPLLDFDRKDLKRNINKIEKPKKTDYESIGMKLKLEIMKEKQRHKEQEMKNSQQHQLELRLASVSSDLKEKLQAEFLFPLEKPSSKFPNALFYCRLCNYHCDKDNYQRHIKQANHITQRNIQQEDVFLQNLPYPTEPQCSALTKLLLRVANEHGLSAHDLQQRQLVAERLNTVIQENGLSDCKFQMCGSSLSGFATKESDLNLDLIFPTMDLLPKILFKLQEVLRDCEDLGELNTDFESKTPKIVFIDKISKLKCDITWNNMNTVQTSRLLGRYRNLDPRVHILGVAFKLWAKICQIDCQSRGTLPSHAYAIMLIYFLQQMKPSVLPVLHEVEPNMDPENSPKEENVSGKWKCQNNQSIGELWIDLFRFYAVTFKAVENVVCIRFRKKMTRAERNWNGKVIAIEDPYFRKRNLSRCIPNQTVYRFIQERFREGYKYFAVPQLHRGPLFFRLDPEVLKMSRKGKTLDPSLESGGFSSQEEDDESEQQDWRRRKLGETSRDGNDFEGHDSSSSDEDLLADQDPELNLNDIRRIEGFDLGESSDDRKYRTESESSDANPLLVELESEHSTERPSFGSPTRKGNVSSKLATPKKRPESPPCPFIVDIMSSFKESDLNYQFDKETLTNNEAPPIYCGVCTQQGHLKDDCPTLVLPPLIELQPLPSSYLGKLTKACMQVMNEIAPSRRETEDRNALLADLQTHIRLFYPDANLELFGSSCNGFVFAGSDMDICLTFNDKKGESLDHAEIIDQLAQRLQTHEHLHNILPITTAKVPIVKFNHSLLKVECDISLYNTLAQHNTRMLLAYCKIDERVRVLGYTMKLFAKLCDIGDASRGSLSSYAYILMVLYFLQQRNPPVIPVLQELYSKDEPPPELIVDKWNAWFYQDLDKLSEVWPEQGKNNESISELWIGLLRFYTEDFNFKEHVICIRQKALLTRLEKVWNAKIICIEDPFDLNHNLGIGVSRKMSIYIMKALIRGRELFGTYFEHFKSVNLKKYLFDEKKLMVEAPPNDRGCRACGKIGHKVKDCPNRRGSRPSQLNKRQEQSQQQQYSQHDRQRGGAKRDEKGHQKMDGPRTGAGKMEPGHPIINQNSMELVMRHLASRNPEQHNRSIQKPKPQNMQLHQQHHQQHRGSPNQKKGGHSPFNDNNRAEGVKFCASLPVNMHQLQRMPLTAPVSPHWTTSSPNSALAFPGSPQGPLLPPPVIERTPRRENSNPTPSSPIQTMSHSSRPMAYFQGQAFPLGYPVATSSGPLNTSPSVHGVMYPPHQQARTPPKPVGREETQLMCRPPAPPPFSNSMWVVNGPSYSQSPPQPPPHMNPNSPMRPMVMAGGAQVLGSPQALLGTSPQQVTGMSPLAAHYQHLALHPDNSVSSNRTLSE